MNQKLPSPKFEEGDVTRMIANFGSKPAPEKKQELTAMLKTQKEQFLTNERGTRSKDGRDRSNS